MHPYFKGASSELGVKLIARERDGDAAAAEVDERDQGFGGVKAEGAVADQADLAVEAFVARIGEAEADGGEDAVAVGPKRPGDSDERP